MSITPPQCKLNTLLFRFKDALHKKIHSNLVYRYICSTCNATYYCKTYHHLFTRAVEHMDVSNLTGKLFKNVRDSAVSDYLLQSNCTIDSHHSDILATVSKFILFVNKSLLIKCDNPVLNRATKSFHFKLFK